MLRRLFVRPSGDSTRNNVFPERPYFKEEVRPGEHRDGRNRFRALYLTDVPFNGARLHSTLGRSPRSTIRDLRIGRTENYAESFRRERFSVGKDDGAYLTLTSQRSNLCFAR